MDRTLVDIGHRVLLRRPVLLIEHGKCTSARSFSALPRVAGLLEVRPATPTLSVS